jgi:hypothetical protein
MRELLKFVNGALEDPSLPIHFFRTSEFINHRVPEWPLG